jgi:large repetitive protein
MRRNKLGLYLAVVLMTGGVVIAIPGTADAAGTNLLTETFTNSTTASSGWQMPTGSSGVCLTAGTNTSATPIPDCDSGTPDPNGSGALQLTNNGASRVGTVYNSVALPTSDGLDVTWDSYQFNGTGADGISFDLASVNPNNPIPPTTVGPSGGSLGYAADGSNAGVPYGYLGFGADVYGNYENSSFSGSGCGQSQPAIAESMGVRGPGNGTVGYCLLAQDNLPAGTTLDSRTATSRGTGGSSIAVPEEVVINPSGSTVTASSSGASVPGGDWMFATEPLVSGAPGSSWVVLEGPLPTDPQGVPSNWLNGAGLPEELAFGWASSTGGSNEYHQINFLQASSLTAAPSLAVTNTDSAGGSLTVNTPVTVTLTPSVPNSSAVNESQSVTVSDNFPASLDPTAASGGPNWTCTVTGQVVSCSYTGTLPLTPGTALPAISVTVDPVTSGAFSNAANVSSTDAAPATAVDSGSIGAAPQVITFTNSPPPSVRPGTTYTVSATGGGSGNPVTFSVDGTSTSGCTVNGTTGLVTMSLPIGTCVIDANQAGNGAYLAATQVQQSVSSRDVNPQTITFTNTPPASPVAGTTYTVTATGGASGNPVVFSVDPSSTSGCTVNAATGLVTLTDPAGTCVIDANQAGDSNFAAAGEVRQSVTSVVPAGAPTATITSPSSGGNYSVGQSVKTTFVCADPNGPGIATCTDGSTSNGSGTLSTSSPGEFTYTVTATSIDGQTTTTNLRYRVVPAGTSLIIYFPNNSWALTRAAIDKLNGLAKVMIEHHFTNVSISGFASSTGPFTNNRELGVQRARAAWSYLRLRLHALNGHRVSSSLRGYGATHFSVTPTYSAGNRRAVLTVT